METENITKDDNEKPLDFEPRITSERWSEGIYNAETKQVSSSLYIKEDELLSAAQREVREARNLIFKYQKMYAQKEHEHRMEQFKKICAVSTNESDESPSAYVTEDKELSSPPEKT